MKKLKMNEKGQTSVVGIGIITLVIDFVIVLLILGVMSPLILTVYNTILAPNVLNLPNSTIILSEVGLSMVVLFLLPIFLILQGLNPQGQRIQ